MHVFVFLYLCMHMVVGVKWVSVCCSVCFKEGSVVSVCICVCVYVYVCVYVCLSV